MPKEAVAATSQVLDRLPFTPSQAEWLHALRTPVVMNTSRARRLLRWRPKYDAAETLRETVEGARDVGLVG